MSFASDIGRMVARGPQRPMTEKESLDLLSIMFVGEGEPCDQQVEFYKECLRQSTSLKILDSRFRYHFGNDVQFSPLLLVWLSALADRPGHVVLLLAVLAHMQAEGHELSLNNLVTYYFSNGIPTDVNYQLAWDAQKLARAGDEVLKSLKIENPGSDNVLDHQQAWN